MKIMSKIIATTTAVACVAAFSAVGVSAAFAQDANGDTAVIAPAPGTEAAPFKITANGKNLTDISITKGGYSYTRYPAPDYAPVESTADLYTVTLPKGVTEVTFNYDKPCLTYNYDSKGQYLSGSVADPTVGSTTVTRPVDSEGEVYGSDEKTPADGEPDYIWVQNPYNADYSGGELLYAIQFKYAENQPGKPGYKPIAKAGVTYSFDGKSLTAIGASKSKKTVTIPATLKYGSKSYKVTGIASKAFKGTKVTSVKVKTNAITKKTTKNCLKSSKVSKVTVYASSAKVANKTAKCFTKVNAGKKVKVVAKVTSK